MLFLGCEMTPPRVGKLHADEARIQMKHFSMQEFKFQQDIKLFSAIREFAGEFLGLIRGYPKLMKKGKDKVAEVENAADEPSKLIPLLELMRIRMSSDRIKVLCAARYDIRMRIDYTVTEVLSMSIKRMINKVKTEYSWKKRVSDAPKAFASETRELTRNTIKKADKGDDLSESHDTAEDMMNALNADEEIDWGEDVGGEVID